MKVRVKYCGGCNPRYDRKAVVDKLHAAFPQTEFVGGGEEGDVDYVAVVCGCHAACADHDALTGLHGKMLTTSDEEYERLAEAIRQAGGK